MLNDIKNDAQARMAKSIDALRFELTKLRTGRASSALVDNIKVPYYGSDMPLSQVATVAVADARTLTITPWEKGMVGPIEKAIYGSDLGLTPNTAGTVIRIPLPPLTEERRRDILKVVRADAEGARVSVRNVRRDAIAEVKEAVKEKILTQDDERRGGEEIQKLTDKAIADIEEHLAAKEKEILQV